MDPGPHNGGGARWRWPDTVHKSFVNSTEIVFAVVPLSSTIDVTCNQVNFLRNQSGTSKNELNVDAFLLGRKCCLYVETTLQITNAPSLVDDEIWHVKEHLA